MNFPVMTKASTNLRFHSILSILALLGGLLSGPSTLAGFDSRLHRELLERSIDAFLFQLQDELKRENSEISEEELKPLIDGVYDQMVLGLADADQEIHSYINLSADEQEHREKTLTFKLENILSQWRLQTEANPIEEHEAQEMVRELVKLYLLQSVFTVYSKNQLQLRQDLFATYTKLFGIALTGAGFFVDPSYGLEVLASGWLTVLLGSTYLFIDIADPDLPLSPLKAFMARWRPKLPWIERLATLQDFTLAIGERVTRIRRMDSAYQSGRRFPSWSRQALYTRRDDFDTPDDYYGLPARYYLEALRRISDQPLHVILPKLNCSDLFSRGSFFKN